MDSSVRQVLLIRCVVKTSNVSIFYEILHRSIMEILQRVLHREIF